MNTYKFKPELLKLGQERFGSVEKVENGAKEETKEEFVKKQKWNKELKEKRADRLKVGDETRDYGVIKKIDISVDGNSITIEGSRDRITVWKYTLIDLV